MSWHWRRSSQRGALVVGFATDHHDAVSRPLEVENDLDRTGVVGRPCLGHDRALLTLRATFERVANTEEARGDDRADRSATEPVDRSSRIASIGVVGVQVRAVRVLGVSLGPTSGIGHPPRLRRAERPVGSPR